MAGALGSNPADGIPAGDTRTSAAQNTSVGSGSRPGPSKIKIETSTPKDHRMIHGEPPAGWLK